MSGLWGKKSSSGSSGSSSKPTDKGRAKVAKNPDNVLGGYTDKTKPEGYEGKISSGGYLDDGARRMPSANDAVAQENERLIRAKLVGRSGRTATDLSGTRAYANNNLGGTL